MPTSKAKQWTVGTILTALLSGGSFVGIDEYIDYKIDQRLMNKTGGFRTALSKEIGVKPELVPHEFGKMFRWVNDSVVKFSRETMPVLRKIKSERKIGPFVNLLNDRIMFMEGDGSPTRTHKNESGEYFIGADGTKIYFLIYGYNIE